MEISDVESEKKMSKSKTEASDFDSEKKKCKTEASDLESEMMKKKNKRMSKYRKRMKKIMRLEKEKEKEDLEARKMKMSLEKSSQKEKDTNPDEKEANPIEKCPNLSSYSTASESEDEALTQSDMDKYREYCRQMVSSGGFDIDRCPPLFQCSLIPVNPSLKKGDEEYDNLCRFSKLAIHQYNSAHARNYEFVKYVKAVSALCAGEKYYITFEAKEDKDVAPTTFQGLVYEGIPERKGTQVIEELEVLLVRKKSSATEKDNNILLC